MSAFCQSQHTFPTPKHKYLPTTLPRLPTPPPSVDLLRITCHTLSTRCFTFSREPAKTEAATGPRQGRGTPRINHRATTPSSLSTALHLSTPALCPRSPPSKPARASRLQLHDLQEKGVAASRKQALNLCLYYCIFVVITISPQLGVWGKSENDNIMLADGNNCSPHYWVKTTCFLWKLTYI